MPADVRASLDKGRWSDALARIEKTGSTELRDEWRKQVRAGWLRQLRASKAPLTRQLDDVASFRARWPRDAEAQRIRERLDVRVSEESGRFAIEGNWAAPRRDIQLAMKADPVRVP